jgi:hypothetical protein
MAIIDIIFTYIHYLIHPFQTHESFLNEDKTGESDVYRLSVYESLGTSWIFVVINGIFRICILNFVLVFIFDLLNNSEIPLNEFIDLSEIPTYSFLVLSAVLDVIFYPLFGIFMIQYWEVVIKFFAKLMKTPGDITQKTQDILTVAFSSQILKVVPVVGSGFSSMANLVLMYAGLRMQIKASPALSVIIILTPVITILFALSAFLLIFLLMI